MKTTYIILILLLATSLQAQWSNDPNDNLIIGYGWDPHIVSDSAGGCYVTYNYESFYPQKLAVERLDKYGYKPWGDKNQILGELPEQWQAEIVEDGEGGVIVSYQDNEVIGTDYVTRVRVQRVDSNGNFLWGQTGVRVSIEEKTHGAQEIVNDGDGGCVVLWQDNIGKYYINRISGLGERVWGDSGKVIGTSAYTGMKIIRASDNNFYIQTGEYIYRIRQNGEIVSRDSVTLGYIVPDSEGGIVLSGRVWTGMIPKLVAQRQDSLGNNLWQEPYVEIADSLGLGSFRMGVNKSVINYSWLGTHNGQTDRPFIQAINLSGNILYQNKILLSEDSSGTTIIGIIASYNHNNIFSWSIADGTNSIFAQMYDTLGSKSWNENGIIVAHPRMIYQQYITDSRGGFIIAGLINNFTVVVQQVSKNGILGEVITNIDDKNQLIFPEEIILYQNYPNPFNASTIIQFQLPKENEIKIDLYNVLGERIQTIADGFYSGGMNSIYFTSDDLPSGIYLYKLQTENKSLTKKLTIIK